MQTPILQAQYTEKVVPALREQFGYKNIMQVPRIEKVIVNVGYGRKHKEKAFIEHAEKTLTAITGQKPLHNAARKSIANFKIREGMNVGVSVTLRGQNMYEFLYRMIHLALPRVRDFRGLSPKAFDQKGNYTIGLKDQSAFPEITSEMADLVHGLEITVVSSAQNREEGKALLSAIGFPFKDAK